MDRKQMRLKKTDNTTHEIRGLLWKSKGNGFSTMWNNPEPYSNNQDSWDVFETKYPDITDTDTVDWKPLINHITLVATGKDEEFMEFVDDYFDLPVFIDYYIFINAFNAIDNLAKNKFLAIYDKAVDTKITLAVWDLDRSFGSHYMKKYGDQYISPTYIIGYTTKLDYRLSTLDYHHFNDSVAYRYHELRKNIFSTDSLCNRFNRYYHCLKNSGAHLREKNKWSGDSDLNGDSIDYDQEIIYICNWIESHLQIVDNELFPAINSITTLASTSNNNHKLYNIYGNKMHEKYGLRPGIYIKNRRKFIIQ